jgi:hypothetical protein
LGYGVQQVSEGQNVRGGINIVAGAVGMIPILGGFWRSLAGSVERPVIEATLHLSASESVVVRDAVGAGVSMTKKEVEEGAVLSAGWALTGEGHEIVGSVQNASNHGLDLVTRFESEYYVWEIKGNSSELSAIQRLPAEFVATRVGDAIHNPAAYDRVTRDLAAALWQALGNNQVNYGVFRVWIR